MAPYDKVVVYGPDLPSAICADIYAKTGVMTCIVDVNDVGGVDVVGSSWDGAEAPRSGSGLGSGLRSGGGNEAMDRIVREALRRNPGGNDQQRTPLVLLRPAPPTRDEDQRLGSAPHE